MVKESSYDGPERLQIETDVLIIGGGMAACWAGISAARTGAKVVLLDKGYVGTSGVTATAGRGSGRQAVRRTRAKAHRRAGATGGHFGGSRFRASQVARRPPTPKATPACDALGDHQNPKPRQGWTLRRVMLHIKYHETRQPAFGRFAPAFAPARARGPGDLGSTRPAHEHESGARAAHARRSARSGHRQR